jgi:glycogen phosphorylase
MKSIRTFNVRPSLPEALQPLLRIARNLRWSWDHAAIDLFRRLDRDMWETCNRNPVLLLGTVNQDNLEAAARDDSFVAHMKGVADKLNFYVSGEGAWYRREHGGEDNMVVAYFSAEFGLTECLSIFAGGLGVLAGDHLKASSDLDLPLTAVGLLYQEGYFRQYLNASGWQQEAFEDNDFHAWPVELVPNVRVQIELGDRKVDVQVWRAMVGRVQLYLLDSNLPSNHPQDRKITSQLYGGDLDMRIRQEIVLGVGGYRALKALGLKPTVYHINEGHSVFLGLEHIRELMETENLTFGQARVLASASLIFTTHTPVPAGHDYYPTFLMDRYFPSFAARLGISRAEFLGLGRQDPGNEQEDFCMTVLALRISSFSNGVSKLHGEVSRSMWNRIWNDLPESEVPIGYVTNGVHFRTWVSMEMNQLYDRYLGPKWREEPADKTLWQRADSIPAGELWRTHERRRERLVGYARRRLREQLIARGATKSMVEDSDEVLSPDALTIGFGRRFASYKRATLLLRDPERLSKILNNTARPVQIIYSGKAHPKDDAGKQLIQTIINLAARPDFRRKLVFLENYDMSVARYMVQGCDVWLNTPLRPQEASGTSGMKALANGVINLSTLDGWWDEAWRMGNSTGSDVGWAIGNGESYDDASQQDQVESEALYELLEREIVPAFYDRKSDGLPRKWIAVMKRSIAKLCPQFNMHRMAMQYADEYYLVAHRRYRKLNADGMAGAKDLATWLGKVEHAWPGIYVESAGELASEIRLGDEISVSARVALNGLAPADVAVQVLTGLVCVTGEIKNPAIVPMLPSGQDSAGNFLYKSVVQTSARSGLHGYAIRVLPKHIDAVSPYLPGLIKWAPASSVVAELQIR